MTTTAYDDSITPATQTILRVIEPQQQIHDTRLAAAIERAEAAEAELARLAQQKPVAWCDPVEFKDDPWSFQGFRCRTSNYPTMPLYAAPVPAPHKGATHCDDCGLTWLDDGLNPLGCPYCKAAVPAPAVPDEWKQAVSEFLSSHDAAWAELFKSLPADIRSVPVSNHQADAVSTTNVLRALLQSAEAQASDKLQLTPAPTHPVDRNAGEVRHD